MDSNTYYQLDYSHDQIEQLLDVITTIYENNKNSNKYNKMLSSKDYDDLKKLVSCLQDDKIMTFSGKYSDLEGTPDIPKMIHESLEAMKAELVVPYTKEEIDAAFNDLSNKFMISHNDLVSDMKKDIDCKITDLDEEIQNEIGELADEYEETFREYSEGLNAYVDAKITKLEKMDEWLETNIEIRSNRLETALLNHVGKLDNKIYELDTKVYNLITELQNKVSELHSDVGFVPPSEPEKPNPPVIPDVIIPDKPTEEEGDTDIELPPTPGIGGGNVDLSDYATKDELLSYVKRTEIASYATKQELTNAFTTKEYDTLITTDKTVIGAINEASQTGGSGEGGGGGSIDPALEDRIAALEKLLDTPASYTKPSARISISPTVLQHAIATDINITPSFVKNDAGDMTSCVVSKAGEEIYNSDTTSSLIQSVVLNHGESLTYTVTISYGDGPIKNTSLGNPDNNNIKAGSVSASATITAYANSYYGAIKGSTVTDDIVATLTSKHSTNKQLTNSFILNDERIIFMYPKSFGTLTSIKDANNFDYIGSYTRSEYTYNNVDYYVYILTDPTTEDEGLRQVFS